MNKNMYILTLTLFITNVIISKETKNTTCTQTATAKKNSKTVANTPLKQGDTLNIAEFTEFYPSIIDKHGNMQTEPILFKITKKGTGSKVTVGEIATVHYTGCLPLDMASTKTMVTRSKIEKKGTITVGAKFDSSFDRNQPFQFKVGAKQVISGWDIIVADMKIGEERIIILPANQAYGARAVGKIPANATLIFEIKLIQAS